MLSSYNERDFQRLHTEWVRVNRHHSGILLVVKRSNYSPGEDLRRIAQLDNALEDADARDLLLYLSNFG
jgi:hypothetical protein